ncbi:P2X purinoceptor 7-like [Protopterus annectens]|uniref:P2X purinoceptor 7-like n=1 Tax=Protopterus annectens TaxID=7888 RepID=UPI001CFA8B6A|nr:P2X purinoceptor 7-like [Protopterus annectens]
MASQQKSRTIVPYSFEPVYTDGQRPPKRARRCSSSSEEDDACVTEDEDMKWCTCQLCIPMSTARECYCCASSTRAKAKIIEIQPPPHCITAHPLFESTCLTTHMLHILMRAMYYFKGHFQRTQWTNRVYRFVAYRAYVLWMYDNKKLGYGHRVVIPSCVVNSIRQRFPSEENDYVGFQAFEGFWEFTE